jgi:hypothetical protein
MQDTGHSPSHAPQLMHSSLIEYATVFTSFRLSSPAIRYLHRTAVPLIYGNRGYNLWVKHYRKYTETCFVMQGLQKYTASRVKGTVWRGKKCLLPHIFAPPN